MYSNLLIVPGNNINCSPKLEPVQMSIEEQLNKYLHVIKYPTIERNEVLLDAKSWKDLEIIALMKEARHSHTHNSISMNWNG